MTGSKILGDHNKTEQTYLSNSLNVLVACTYKGVSPEVQESLNAMSADPRNNKTQSNIDAFNKYQSQIVGAVHKNYFNNDTGIAASQFVAAATATEAPVVSAPSTTTSKNNLKA